MNFNAFAFKRLLPVFFVIISLSAFAQHRDRSLTDSLLHKLTIIKEDTNKVNLLIKTAKSYYALSKPDSITLYLQQALILATQLKWEKGIAKANYNFGGFYFSKANYVKAKNYLTIAADLNFKTNDYNLIYESAGYLGQVMSAKKQLPEYISYLKAYAQQFKKAGSSKKLAYTYVLIADFNQNQFNFGASMEYYNKALALEGASRQKYLDNFLLGIAYMYTHLHNTDKARTILQRAETSFKKAGDSLSLSAVYLAFAECDNADHRYPAAIANYNKVVKITEKARLYTNLSTAENSIAWDYHLMKEYDKAYPHAVRAILFARSDSTSLIYALSTLGTIYREAPETVIRKAGMKPGRQFEKSVALLLEGLKYGKDHNDFNLYNSSYEELSLTYEKMHRYADALKMYKTFIARKDSTEKLTNEKAVLLKEAQTDFLLKEDSLNFKQGITNTALKQKKLQSCFYIGGIAALLLLSLFIALNYNNQRKSNKLLAKANEQITLANHALNEQREEITTQRDQLTNTIADLQAAQQQLIQAEKMASLGELTAGIAHEIQNPLNFVNNFSEVSAELTAELKEELRTGNVNEAIAIADDLEQNLNKIRHHGVRADNIVKGMLQHSRQSSGVKEVTNINNLAEEYLRLAYYGIRTRDKAFNAELGTAFADDLPMVNVVTQDMSRVLLNLFNNAFYAVQKKQKTAIDDYKPAIKIATAAIGNELTITVEDNGMGIPDNIKEKIFQPFFTTKPTGEGTGLGLSLSYDIIVKGHGGKIYFESKPETGSVFTVILPIVLDRI